MSKSARYFYDADAIRETQKQSTIERCKYGFKNVSQSNEMDFKKVGRSLKKGSFNEGLLRHEKQYINPLGRNLRTVWTIATQPFPEAHFATFPEALVEPCILAGCPVGGLVLDPFMGSGTVALVAHRLDRDFIGFELSKEYCEIAEKRIKAEVDQGRLFVETSN